MSKNLPNMLESTIAKLREMLNANSVIGQPIVVDGVTIIPISEVSVGFGGGGSDYVSKHPNTQENPFGGGVCAGTKVNPVAFLVIKDGNTRMIPVPVPANTTVDRVVEMIPDTLDKIANFVESKTEKKAE